MQTHIRLTNCPLCSLATKKKKRHPQVGSGASLWYGAVVRGDVNHVVIGSGSSVGDSAVVHVAGLAGNKPTIVGSNVVIGECISAPFLVGSFSPCRPWSG